MGYVEGQSIVIEERWAEGKLERFGDLIADRQSRPVNVRVGRLESQAARCYERMRRWRRWNYAMTRAVLSESRRGTARPDPSSDSSFSAS